MFLHQTATREDAPLAQVPHRKREYGLLLTMTYQAHINAAVNNDCSYHEKLSSHLISRASSIRRLFGSHSRIQYSSLRSNDGYNRQKCTWD